MLTDGQADRRTRMTKRIVAFGSFANALKNRPMAAIELRFLGRPAHNLVAKLCGLCPKCV